MSVTKASLNKVLLSDNIAIAQLGGDQFFSNYGTKNRFTITISNNTTNNKIITIVFPEFTMVLTFKTSPNDTGLQLPLTDITDNSSYDALKDAFESNYYLRRFFDRTEITTSLSGDFGRVYTFTAKVAGQAFKALSIDSDDIGKVDVAVTVAGADVVLREGAMGRIEIWNKYGSSFANEKLIGTLEATPVGAEDTLFDLSVIFKKWLELNPSVPDYFLTERWGAHENMVKAFYLRYMEIYGNPALVYNNITEPDPITSNTLLRVVKGGVAYEKGSAINETADALSYYEVYAKDEELVPLLTERVSGKVVVNKTMVHFINYYSSHTDTARIEGVLYFDDGTNVEFEIGTHAAIPAHQVLYWNVGFDYLELESLIPIGKQAVKYSVHVRSNQIKIGETEPTRLTESFMFELDLRYFEHNHYFYYHNRLGGIETVWVHGDVVEVPEFSGTEVEKAITLPYSTGNILTTDSQFRRLWNVNTGWRVYEEDFEDLKNLINSNYVKWLPDRKVYDKENFVDVIIDKGSVGGWPSDKDNLGGLNFTIKLANLEN